MKAIAYMQYFFAVCVGCLFLYTAAAFAGIPFIKAHIPAEASPTPRLFGPATRLLHCAVTKINT